LAETRLEDVLLAGDWQAAAHPLHGAVQHGAEVPARADVERPGGEDLLDALPQLLEKQRGDVLRGATDVEVRVVEHGLVERAAFPGQDDAEQELLVRATPASGATRLR
jgi:hypothetical protein